MIFKEINLENFRNYSSQKVEFNKDLNLILGENAQGKTNLLEGLFIMGLGKSFRTNKDQEMINLGSQFARVSSVVEDEDGEETTIEIFYSPEGKIIKVDGIKLTRTVDLLENVYIVVFSPDDLKIVKEGPDYRRRFIDRELCQIKPVYYSDLGNYKKVLKQRNMLLKQQSRDRHLFEVFNESLANYGVRIVEERKKFTDRLLEISSKIHSDITDGKEELFIKYETKVGSKEEFIEKLNSSYEDDIYRGFTGFGPHKDDLCLKINDIDIRYYGSQGQQRTAALSMKLAEIGLIKQETGKNAVLLLDDVLSELDRNRQRYLIEAMKGIQVFVSAASIDDELLKLLPSGNTYFVDNGVVSLYNR